MHILVFYIVIINVKLNITLSAAVKACN